MDTSTTFFFEVVFRDIPVLGETQNYPVSDRSVIVEVEPDSILTTTTYLPLEEAARECAKELATHLRLARCRHCSPRHRLMQNTQATTAQTEYLN